MMHDSHDDRGWMDNQFATLIDQITADLLTGRQVDFEALAMEHPHYAGQLLEIQPTISALADWGDAVLPSATNRDSSCSALGDFRLLSVIGRGGMGIVYEAEQLSLGRHVAVKVLPFAALLEQRQLERFKNEARAAAMLKHPGIVSVHAVGVERGVHFYAMELIDGMSLAQVGGQLRGPTASGAGSRPTRDEVSIAEFDTEPIAQLSTEHHHDRQEFYRSVARLGIQAAGALHYAHQEGVIHRDIKPSNLLLDRDGNLHITDFGLARIQSGDNLTMTGDLVGTLRYMSPEQFDGAGFTDLRTDIYSLGTTLYELICGRPAFSGDSRLEIEQRIVRGEVSRPRSLDPQIPRNLETILLKAVACERDDRYPSATALADDLQRFVSDQPIRARRISAWEQLCSWARRNRRVALLASTIAFLLLLMATTACFLALKFARDAHRQRLSTHSQTIRLAQVEIDRGNNEVAERELLKLVPNAGDEDLRGFPWYWLWDECHRQAAKQIVRHNMGVGNLAWLDNGRHLASCSWSRLYVNDLAQEMTAWEVATGGPVITALIKRRSDDVLIAGRDNGVVTCFDASSKKELNSISLDLPYDEAAVRTISESGDGRFLAFGASAEARYGSTKPGHVWIWDVAENKFVHKLSDDLTGRVVAAFVGEQLVASSYTGKLLVFNTTTWQRVRKLDCRGMVTALAVSADGKLVATSSATGHGNQRRSHIDNWDVDRWQRLSTVTPHNKPIRALAFDRDSKRLAAGDDGGRLALIDVGTSHILANLQIHTDSISAVAFSPNDQLVATGSSDNTARIWELESLLHPPEGKSAIATVHGESIYSAELLDNGQTVASVDNSGRLLIWDVATGNTRAEFVIDCENMKFSMLGVAPDRRTIAVSRHQWPFDGSASVLAIVDVSDVANPELCWRLPLPRGVVYGRPAFSHDSELVAIGSNEQVVVFSTTTGQLITELPCGHWVKCMDFSPDGKWLVASGDGRWAHIYRTHDWHLMGKVPLQAHSNMTIAVAPDGRCFATGGSDGQVRLWSLPAGQPVGRQFKNTSNWILNVRFSPDGRHLLTSGKDGTLRLWLRESGEELLSLPITYGWLCTGSFSPDGQTIVTGANTDVFLFRSSFDDLARLSVNELEARACQPEIHVNR